MSNAERQLEVTNTADAGISQKWSIRFHYNVDEHYSYGGCGNFAEMKHPFSLYTVQAKGNVLYGK